MATGRRTADGGRAARGPATPWPCSATSWWRRSSPAWPDGSSASLQDTQNDLLDRLRVGGDDLVAGPPARRDRAPRRGGHRRAAAARGGRRRRGLVRRASTGSTAAGDALVAIAHELAESVVGPLRKRLDRRRRPRGGRGVGGDRARRVGLPRVEGRADRAAGRRPRGGGLLARVAGRRRIAGTGLEWVAVALPGEIALPRLRGQRAERRPAAGEAFPTGHRIPRPTRAVDACSRSSHPLGCCRANSE